MAVKVGNYYQYSGAVHIHTTESDGTKSLEEVIEIGRRADLDFMMFADHMTLSNRERGGEGLYGKTLVVIGYEHNDEADTHHYLLFDSPKVYPANMSAGEYVAAGAADNAVGILAHPDEIRHKLPDFPPYPWTDWDVVGYQGIELWNQMSEWMESLTWLNKLHMALSPRKSMVGPTDRIMRKWDLLNLTGKFVGVAGVDAHGFPVRFGPFTIRIFPYKTHFRCLRTHILLHEPMAETFDAASRQLYDALLDCRVFFSNMRWGSADGFEFLARSDNGEVTCGEELEIDESAEIICRLPSPATLRLVHNGKKILQIHDQEMRYLVKEPGTYRVEAYKGKRGWIFSNHLRLMKADDEQHQ